MIHSEANEPKSWNTNKKTSGMGCHGRQFLKIVELASMIELISILPVFTIIASAFKNCFICVAYIDGIELNKISSRLKWVLGCYICTPYSFKVQSNHQQGL